MLASLPGSLLPLAARRMGRLALLGWSAGRPSAQVWAALVLGGVGSLAAGRHQAQAPRVSNRPSGSGWQVVPWRKALVIMGKRGVREVFASIKGWGCDQGAWLGRQAGRSTGSVAQSGRGCATQARALRSRADRLGCQRCAGASPPVPGLAQALAVAGPGWRPGSGRSRRPTCGRLARGPACCAGDQLFDLAYGVARLGLKVAADHGALLVIISPDCTAATRLTTVKQGRLIANGPNDQMVPSLSAPL